MSEAPDSRRPAARTRTATYFILSSPRYVRFPGLVFRRPGVSEYTPGPSLASRSLGFFLIEVIREEGVRQGCFITTSTIPCDGLQKDCRKCTSEHAKVGGWVYTCLLYTSDAADE